MKRSLVVSAAALVVTATAQAAAPTLTAEVRPGSPAFGDPFSYVVTATVPAAEADTTQIVDDVLPFVRIAPTRTSRTVENGIARIRLTESLACLSAECVPTERARAVAMPRVRVVGSTPGVVAPRVVVLVKPRVSAKAVAASKPVFQSPATLAPVETGLGNGITPLALGLAGLAAIVAGGWGLVAVLRRGQRTGIVRGSVDPVERAARLLRESASRDTADRRRAASLAARVVHDPSLSFDAARIAWSPAAPAPPDADTLAERVEQTAGARG